jgi:hypothetical protein
MKITKKTMKTVLITILCLILFCSIPVIFRVYLISELPSYFTSAAMGAVITGVITLILLRGQSDAQEVKERNVMIFKKKSKIFGRYIDLVWQIWEGNKITNEQYQKLTSEYYKNLMIYLKDESPKGKDSNLKKIGEALSGLGDCLEKESYDDIKNIQANIIIIINALSNELGTGGQINHEQIEDHDKKLFPALFRKQLIDSLNEKLLEPNSGILDNGHWEKWREFDKEKSIYEHDDMVFAIKKYPGCSIRIGLTNDINSNSKYFNFILYVPIDVSEPLRGWIYAYRPYARTKTCNQIILDLHDEDKFFQNSSPEGSPLFDFKYDNSINEIRKKNNYRQIAETVAVKASEVFGKFEIVDYHGTSKISFKEFLEKY